MLGGLRNQFTLPESVEAGLYAGDFLRLIQLNRSVPNDMDVRCHFNMFSIDQSMINDHLQLLDPKLGLWRMQLHLSNKKVVRGPWIHFFHNLITN